ncbi:MAG: glycoside hydrolase family 3 C-terminal domain-containing protein [Bacteroidales bacterium]|jgi:beta-glucosidase
MRNRFIALSVLLSSGVLINAQSVPQLGKAHVKSVVAAMTLEEKATLVVGAGMRMSGIPGSIARKSSPVGQTQDLVAGVAGNTYAIPRLGIPQMVLSDGPAGVRINPTRPNDQATYYCTAFPVATLLASTWDVDLVNKVGQAMGNEVLEYGIDILLGPALNTHRNPLCGRNFEYYSEDPLITGKIAAAMVKGVQSNGVGTSIKHFAANNAETNRNTLNTIVSERALREIYLKGFGIAVQEAQPWTVMSSYNLINGVYTSESPGLLTKILRDDWGFRGFVMTDWFGGKDPVAQMAAGNDLLMPGSPNQTQAIIDAVKSGKLDVKLLDRNVERILNIILQSPRFRGYKYSNKPDMKAHAQVTRQAAAEGMVLLKNDNSALPLSQDSKKLALFGNTSYDVLTGGTGSGSVNYSYSVSLPEGLQNDGYLANENLKAFYASYILAAKEGAPKSLGFMMGQVTIGEMAITADIAASMASVTDAAIITIGRNAGEGADRKPVEGDFLLSAVEKQLIQLVSTAYHAKNKKVIVILNTGGVMETASWRDMPDAILLAWQGGQESGNSIADILSGKVNPSGRLASTFPMNYSDVPSAGNFPGKVLTPAPDQPESKDQGVMASFFRPKPSEVTYGEGIYVGYRYYNTFSVPVAYEFGYGLSYTTFDISNLKLSSEKFSSQITATVDVRNTGKVAGREVVELYLSAPAGNVDKPESELKGFAKTGLLQPGEMQTMTFTIDGMSLCSFNSASSSWVADAGKYSVKIGASSKDIRQTGTFTLGKTMTVKKVSTALVPKEKVNEIKP